MFIFLGLTSNYVFLLLVEFCEGVERFVVNCFWSSLRWYPNVTFFGVLSFQYHWIDFLDKSEEFILEKLWTFFLATFNYMILLLHILLVFLQDFLEEFIEVISESELIICFIDPHFNVFHCFFFQLYKQKLSFLLFLSATHFLIC